jgi:hypothetical protein
MLKIPAKKIAGYIESRFEFRMRKEGQEYLINNPLTYDTGFHFNINPEKAVCHDWRGDEWAGAINPKTGKRNCSFIKFVSLYEKVDYSEAIRLIMGTDYISFRTEVQKLPVIKEEMSLPRGAMALSTSSAAERQMLERWVISRGYTTDEIFNRNLHHLGAEVIWPYYEYGELVYWQSRSRLNKRFAFPSSEIFDDDGNVVGKREFGKADYLYGFDEAEHGTFVIITEGIFDMHTLGGQALASGGALLTPNQIAKLKLLNPKKGVILAPDNDAAGVNSAFSNQIKLRQANLNAYVSLPPDTVKDWNELVTERKMAKSAIRILFDERIMQLNPVTINKLRIKYRMTTTI